MSVVFAKGENQESKITVTIFEKEYKEGVDKKIKEYTKRANIKGYRPGKVPASLINQLYGNDIINQELKAIAEKQLEDFFQTDELCIVGSLISTDIKHEKTDFIMEYSIDVIPTFNTEIPQDLKFTNYTVEDVPESTIDDQIISLQISQGKTIDSDRINKNSIFFVSISYENYFCPQALMFFPKFSEEMQKPFLEKMKGDTVEYNLRDILENHTTKIFFENNDAPLLDAIPPKVKFTITKIKDVEITDLDKDKLAKTLGVKSIESDEELRNLLKRDMLSSINGFKNNLLKYEVLNKITEELDFELPEYIITKYITDTIETSEERQNKKLIDIKSKSLKWSLICSEIIKKNKLRLSTEAIEAMMKFYANEVIEYYASQMQERLTMPQIKKIIEDNTIYIRNKATKHVQGEVALNFVTKQVVFIDEKISYTDMEKILKNNHTVLNLPL